jgi:hypothetical protein
MTPRRPNPLPIAAAFAVFLGVAGGHADPLPEGTAAPSAPEPQTAPEKAQPPPVMEQNDVPPVAPKEEAPPPAQPEAEKPSAEANPEPSKAAETPKNVEPVAPSQAFAVLGKKVHGPDGKEVFGSIIDILVDDQGRPRAAIVDFGGFLGVGSRKIAVDWQMMKFRPTDQAAPIVLDLDRNEIKAAPEYKDTTQPAEVVEPTVAGASTPPAPGAAESPPLPAPGGAESPPGPASGSEDASAPANSPPQAAPAPPGSVAAPARPSTDTTAPPSTDATAPRDATAPPDADKHAN